MTTNIDNSNIDNKDSKDNMIHLHAGESISIEDYACYTLPKWSEDFFKQEVRELTNDEMYLFTLLLAAPPEKLAGLDVELTNISIAYNIFKKRVAFLGCCMETCAMIFLSEVGKNPGQLVMYATATCVQHALCGGGQPLTLDWVGRNLIPNGILTSPALTSAWNLQKIKGQNLLDYANAYFQIPK